MRSHTLVEEQTRGAVFEPLVAVAKARVIGLVEDGGLVPEDAEFVLRALIELESDGIELFGPFEPADAEFYSAIEDYLVARAGRAAVARVLGPAPLQAMAAASGAARGIAQLRRVSRGVPGSRDLDRVVLELISHNGGAVR
jgi:hypothetical protein